VTFTYLRTTRPFDGLVDSGAERSVCSAAIAIEAGIDLSQFPLRRFKGPSGFGRVRLSPIDLTILERRIAAEILVVDANIVHLGRHDVFRAFQFGFDERAELLLVEPY
jgi:hypothetical protein